MIDDFWHDAGHQDGGRKAGAGHWGGAAHHLHLLLPHGVQRKLLQISCCQCHDVVPHHVHVMLAANVLMMTTDTAICDTTCKTLCVREHLYKSKMHTAVSAGSMGSCLGRSTIATWCGVR